MSGFGSRWLEQSELSLRGQGQRDKGEVVDEGARGGGADEAGLQRLLIEDGQRQKAQREHKVVVWW